MAATFRTSTDCKLRLTETLGSSQPPEVSPSGCCLLVGGAGCLEFVGDALGPERGALPGSALMALGRLCALRKAIWERPLFSFSPVSPSDQ